MKWEFKLHSKPQAGILSTTGGLAFVGDNEGHFFALDDRTGKERWRANTGGTIAAGPISYLHNGKQHVAVAAGSAIFVFELP